MNVRWSSVGVVVVGLLAIVPLRPVESARGEEMTVPVRKEEVTTQGLRPADPPRPPEPFHCGKYQFIETAKMPDQGAALSAPFVLFDTETGRVWRLDKTNPENLRWKLAVDAPK
jgi:hypothetical protein